MNHQRNIVLPAIVIASCNVLQRLHQAPLMAFRFFRCTHLKHEQTTAWKLAPIEVVNNCTIADECVRRICPDDDAMAAMATIAR